MILDRNNPDRDPRGKYALVLIRALNALSDEKKSEADEALAKLRSLGVLEELGDKKEPRGFFVLRFQDRFSACALSAYAVAADADPTLSHYSNEVLELAKYARSLKATGASKRPD